MTRLSSVFLVGVLSFASSVAALLFLSCAAPGYLGGTGSLRPEVTNLQTHLDAFAIQARAYDPEEPTTHLRDTANDVLDDLFGSIRNPDLADLLVYLPADGQYVTPVLVNQGNVVRMLDAEGVMWVVVVVSKAAVGNKACPRVPLRLTSLGETRPSIAISVESLVTAAVMRNSAALTSTDPKDEKVDTEDIPGASSLCWGIQRFALQKDSYNRITIGAPDSAPPTDPKIVKIQVMNAPLRVRVDGLCIKCDAGTQSAVDADHAAKGCGDHADGGVSLDSSAPLGRVAEPAKMVFNFANTRVPSYGGSIALGTDLYNFKRHRGCTADGTCTPGLYAFLHLWDFPIPWNIRFPRTNDRPVLRLSLPVIGARLLDPVLGEVVLGARLGIENGLSKPLSRFGVVLGVGYAFRGTSLDKTTKTVDATETQTSTDTSTQVTTKTETTSENRDTDHWRLFLGLDLAF